MRCVCAPCGPQTLDISWNSIGIALAHGITASTRLLCEVLQTKETLTHLDLSHNNINSINGHAIAAALLENHTLRCVRVWSHCATVVLVWVHDVLVCSFVRGCAVVRPTIGDRHGSELLV